MNNIIKNKLFSLADNKYKIFSSRLLPNINNIIGVKIPYLRKIAQNIAANDWKFYIDNAATDYFEEIMIQGLVLGYIKSDINEIIPYWAKFITLIDNWSVCDSFCSGLKTTYNNSDVVFKFIKPYLKSEREFDIRFAVVMLLKWFNKENLIKNNLNFLDSIKNNGYYAQMAIAWAISVFYITSPDITLSYLQNNHLEKFTFKKTLTKINESLQISKEQKAEIKFKLSI